VIFRGIILLFPLCKNLLHLKYFKKEKLPFEFIMTPCPHANSGNTEKYIKVEDLLTQNQTDLCFRHNGGSFPGTCLQALPTLHHIQFYPPTYFLD